LTRQLAVLSNVKNTQTLHTFWINCAWYNAQQTARCLQGKEGHCITN